MKNCIKDLYYISIACLFMVTVACSSNDNVFNVATNSKCSDANQSPNIMCMFNESDNTVTYKYKIRSGKIDILFVIDNSRSMYKEQVKMSEQFPEFVDSLKDMDFQIAMVTTDITTKTAKNGEFLELSNGSRILRNNDGTPLEEIKSVFSESIKRKETASCDASDRSTCPSSDERGIFAAALTLNSSNQEFYRSDAHLAVVLLSDEDVRSTHAFYDNRPLDPEWDTPFSFVSRVAENYGTEKSLSFHSIIIDPASAIPSSEPDSSYILNRDQACYSEQNIDSRINNTFGFYGFQYYALSNPSDELKSIVNIKDGTVGSICADNYHEEMGNIAANVEPKVILQNLACDPLELDVYEAENPTEKVPFTVNAENQVVVDPALVDGVRIVLEAKCDNVH